MFSMYITDKKTKQCVSSYIRHKYGVNLEPHRIYIFKYEYDWDNNRSEYTITKYKEVGITEHFPQSISAKEVDNWGMILSRKEKIGKIRNNGSMQGII